MKRRPAILALLASAVALGLLGASPLPWSDLTPADWLYAVATRFATVDGHTVHYPTPPAELARLLEGRTEAGAWRNLAEARLALGDRAGALAAMEQGCAAEAASSPAAGAEAWAETARWAAEHLEMAAAFRAAEKALPGLGPEAKLALSKARIAWAERHPDLGDALAFRKAQAAMFPEDGASLEAWLRALEKAGRLAEADQALAASKALDPERRLLLRSDLRMDHQDAKGAFEVLDAALDQAWSADVRQAWARRVDAGAPRAPEGWRTVLDARYDAGALVRLASYHQGQGRGDAAAELLRQVERRHSAGFDRKAWLLLARLHGELDAAPEAFRARLAAAQLGTPEEQTADLAALATLALQAGGRPVAWGTANDEPYRWVADLDRTPGFWTGGLSFLLTGGGWKEALERLENESLADRTFATARALAEVLARRAPKHPDLPALRVALMERHVQRGEGRAALDILPLVEGAGASPAVLDEARRVALLAARQSKLSLDEETRLFKARLRHAAADGTKDPSGLGPRAASEGSDAEGEAPPAEEGSHPAEDRPWARNRGRAAPVYRALLDEAVARLDDRDKSHRAALALLLGEMDRMPDAEALWMSLADRLEGWNLDDDLGPRFEQALKRFQGEGIWHKAARWYARRSRHDDLRKLAAQVAGQFRGSALFARSNAGDVRVELPDQPAMGGRVRLVPWADWVRFKALERFPQSPQVFREVQRLVAQSAWAKDHRSAEGSVAVGKVVVSDALLETRRWALLHTDPAVREDWFAKAMKDGALEAKLSALEARSDRTPVEDQLLFEGWSRLSRFEKAVPAADRLAAAYPGDGDLARRVLSLHRSLNALESSHAAAARALVVRTAPALMDAAPLWTELGELEEERGHPAVAMETWKNVLGRDTRNPDRVAELATLLWDYNHDREALAVVEEGRKALGRPRFFAFETGVLRENVRDLDGAIREYLDALRPESDDGFFSWYERDQRSLRRLAQLLSRDKVYRRVERRIRDLKPGSAEDEHTLAAFLPLATLETPTPGLAFDSDDWMDGMDLPNDPKGRDERDAKRDANRPAEHDAIARLGDLLLEKSREMAAGAQAPGFLDAIESWSRGLIEARWKQDRIVAYRNQIMARRAQLAASEEDRINLETERARYLADHGRGADADALWTALDARIAALPEGSVKLKAEAGRAAYLERAKGTEAAAKAWAGLTARYPWSLGLLEDRLAFLNRVNRGAEARAALEAVLPRAAAGHKEGFLERLTSEALAAGDLAQARRAVSMLLAQEGLDEGRRLGALHLQARLAFRENPAWDPYPAAKAEAAKLRTDLHADLYAQLAKAADLEKATAPVPGLWIEALNRRTDREWLAAAGRSANRAGKGADLLAFFEKQQARSPRDVRWAVAVRDIRRAGHDVDGAIAAAKAAVAVRPEKENLWQEAVDLLVRADRIREAADYLEGWNKARPADEGVARWRSGLYVRAGDPKKALAIEQAALAAFRKESEGRENAAEDLARRKASAASRLFEAGHPDLALAIYSPKGDIRALAGSQVYPQRQAELALLTGQVVRFITQPSGDADFKSSAASFLERSGRPDVKEEVRAFLVRTIFPPNATRPDDGQLRAWWAFTGTAGLEPGVRAALALRLLAQRPGPWQAAPPLAYAVAVGQEMVGWKTENGASVPVFREPDLSGLWARDLVRRDKGAELLAFVEPRWQELLAQVRGSGELTPKSPRAWWAWWLDDPEALKAWGRAAAAQPAKAAELGELLSDRRKWDRFWVLAARGWDAPALLGMATPEARTAWFRFWEPAAPSDPVLLARRATTERVTAAVARLLKNEPKAVEDPLIVKLRGPRTVGEVLSKDARWIWPEFTPRRSAQGELAEQGDDRITGQGADEGRLPGALWGDRPGEAWYVLEALARYRAGDRTAPYLPFAVPQRGAETTRALLALRLAQGLKDTPLALELESGFAGPEADRAWLEGRVNLFVAAGQKDKAASALRAFVRQAQARLTEDEFRWLAAHAEDWGLLSPLELLDPSKPVGPAFLAYLRDRRPEAANRFTTADEVGFRAALASRWRSREAQLSAEQVRFWLRELWTADSAPLPRRGLSKLGPAYLHAADWLQRQPGAERSAALDALDEALNPGDATPRIFAMLDAGTPDDVNRLLALRLHLARNEGAAALARVDAMLAELRKGAALAYTAREVPVSEAPSEDGEGSGMEDPAPRPVEDWSAPDPLVDRLQAWRRPFLDARQNAAVDERFRRLLKEKREEGPVSSAAWKLAFALQPAAEAAALDRELDEAWFRGEVQPDQLGGLMDTLAGAIPAEAPRWMARWPRQYTFGQAKGRADLLAKLKKPAEACRLLADARRRTPWSEREEVLAFEQWRRLGAASGGEGTPASERAPAAWTAAHAALSAKADASLAAFSARLKAMPTDILTARGALRTAAPLDEEAALRAALAASMARSHSGLDVDGDRELLRLRAARSLLAASPQAARHALGGLTPEAFLRAATERRLKTAEVNLALADLARVAYRTGDEPQARRIAGLLGDRSASAAKALRAEFAPEAGRAVDSFRVVNGRPAPIRPRDLAWPMIANLLTAEGVR
ncbi:MAG: hypothetical protein U0P81_08020 [Holophagaceae bacterium]